jgi:Skp family chaperone for outer membrane proteins
MNCRPMFSFLLALLLPACWVAAQTPPAAQAPPQAATAAPAASITTARIAWINLEEAVFKSEEGKRDLGEVQNFVTKKNQELQALQKELDNLRSQLQVQAAKLTDEARADLEEQIDMKDTALQRFQQDTQKEIDNRRNRVTNSVGRKMVPIIEKVSKEKGLSALFYLNSSRDGWVEPSLIITEDIIKAYNQAYPLTAAKPPAAGQNP